MRAFLLDNNDMHPEGGTRRSCNVWAPLVIFWLTKRMTHPLFFSFCLSARVDSNSIGGDANS